MSKKIVKFPSPPRELHPGEFTGLDNWLEERPALDQDEMTVRELKEKVSNEGYIVSVTCPD